MSCRLTAGVMIVRYNLLVSSWRRIAHSGWAMSAAPHLRILQPGGAVHAAVQARGDMLAILPDSAVIADVSVVQLRPTLLTRRRWMARLRRHATPSRV
jgi:hypothetical protein